MESNGHPKPTNGSVARPSIYEQAKRDGDRLKLPSGEAWLRLPGESEVAFEAFATYRDLAERRSHVRVAEALGKSIALIGRWARRWKWTDRVELFDREEDRLHVIQLRADRRKASRRHARQFAEIQEAVAKVLREICGEGFENLDASSMSVETILRVFDVASKGERLSLGEPTEIVDTFHSGGPSTPEGADDERKPIPLTFGGRIDEALALLETARARATLGAPDAAEH